MGRARLVWLCLALGVTGTAGMLVAGCNTVRGLATDVRQTGEAVVETSEDVGATITGKND